MLLHNELVINILLFKVKVRLNVNFIYIHKHTEKVTEEVNLIWAFFNRIQIICRAWPGIEPRTTHSQAPFPLS